MLFIFNILSKIFDLPTERLNALIALASIDLSVVAVYVIFSVLK